MIARSRLLAGFVLAALAAAQEPTWPPGTADLPADPAIVFDRLQNGLRFAFVPKSEPPGRVALRLVVLVGSLDEEDGERGAAHFVEHMAFNGTRRFPGTSVRDWFRERGMRVGPHVNATTSERETIYAIDLADGSPESLADGLGVLREFAEGILFAADEVEAEKGVVDAEERERPRRERAEIEIARRLGAGTRSAVRPIGGDPAERSKFTPDLLRAFHRRWYRADNMMVVIAGDLDAAAARTACRAAFATMAKPASPMPPRAPRGVPTLDDTSFAIDDPTRGDVTLSIFCPRVRERQSDGAERRRDLVRRHAVNEMARWILDAELRGPGRPALGVDVVDPGPIGLDAAVDGMVVQLTCKPGDVLEALARCARRLTQLREQGFAEGLLERVRQVGLRELDEAAAEERGSETAQVAASLARLLSRDRIPCAPSVRTSLAREAWTGLTTAECTARFRDLWSATTPSITSIGPPGHAIDGAAAWASAEQEVRASRSPAVDDLDTRPRPGAGGWPFASAALDPAPIAARTRLGALDVEDVQFANGVRLLVKKTTGSDGIQVAVEIGLGTRDVTPVERQATTALGLSIGDCGLGSLTAGDVRSVAARHRATVAFRTPPGAFELCGSTDRASLAFQLEWLLAQCTDPRFPPDAVDRAVQAFLLRRKGSSSNDLWMRFCSKLVGQAIHLDTEQLAKIGADEVTQLVRTKWLGAPITVVIVGDVEVDEAVAAVGRTFGKLEQRHGSDRSESRETREIVGGLHVKHDLETLEPASSVFVFAPLSGRRAGGERALLRVLSAVLTDRLEARIREAMGATYSVAVDPMWFAASYRCDALSVQTKVQPGREDEVLDVVRSVAADLHEHGPTAEEVDAAVQLVRGEDRDHRTKNGYWLMVLGLSHAEPSLLASLAAVDARLASMTRDEVHDVARAVLAADGISSLVLRAKRGK